MKERLFFEVEGDVKKEILDALKNEQKYSKKITIKDKYGDEIATSIKWDNYHTYIDFWLDNIIPDYVTEAPGKIQRISLYDFTTSKGTVLKRVKEVIA